MLAPLLGGLEPHLGEILDPSLVLANMEIVNQSENILHALLM